MVLQFTFSDNCICENYYNKEHLKDSDYPERSLRLLSKQSASSEQFLLRSRQVIQSVEKEIVIHGLCMGVERIDDWSNLPKP